MADPVGPRSILRDGGPRADGTLRPRLKLALESLLDAEAGDYESYVQTPYRISVVRYFGNGHEESDWNSDGPNVELDGWGLYLWAARTYVDASGDLAWLQSMTRSGDTVYDVMKTGIAQPLGETSIDSSGMITPDTSIWEAHWDLRKHYAYTTFAAARGLCDFASMAADVKDDATRATYTTPSRKSLVAAARAQLLDANPSSSPPPSSNCAVAPIMTPRSSSH